MKILVTGATGGLGGVTARELVRHGYEVHGIGRNQERGAALERDGITFHHGDITDRAFIRSLLDDDQVIIHCAALSSPWGNPKDFFHINVHGTDIVAEAAIVARARLVHVSSTSVYFDFQDRLNIKETDPVASKFANDYARTKDDAEWIVRHYVNRGLDAVIIRPRAIFGETDTALLPRLLRAAERGFLPLIDGGKALTDLTHVDNVANALILAATREKAFTGEVINISGGEPIMMKDLLGRITRHLGLKTRFLPVPYHLLHAIACLMEEVCTMLPSRPEPILTRYTVGLLAKSQTLCLDLAKKELGYDPIPLEIGLTKTLDAWKANHAS